MQEGWNKRYLRNDKIGRKEILHKCMYTKTHGLRNKQEDLELHLWSLNYDIVQMTEMQWDVLHKCFDG